MSPASYLTAPPRVAAAIVAPRTSRCSRPSGKVAVMADGDMAGLVHPLHADHPRLFTSFDPNDLDIQPPLAKEFPPQLPRVALPHELPSPGGETLAVLAGRAQPAARLDLAPLAQRPPPPA